MAFGQSSGPPAGGRQIDELAGLLERAGYGSFREARHPFGLTQRQAGGKFTAGEADELIERLQAAETVQQPAPPPGTPAAAPDRDVGAVGEMSVAPPGAGGRGGSATRTPARGRSAASLEAQRRREERQQATIEALADDALVIELERRGWCCIPPLTDEDPAD